MKKTSNKNKLILPISTIAISSLAIVSSNLLNNHNNASSKVELKSISSNENQKNNLTNPNELFYLSKQLDSTVNPWNDEKNEANQENVNKWKDFYNNLLKISGTSSTKDELVEIARQVIGVATLKDFYKKLDEYKKDNPFLSDAVIQSIKETLKQESGYKESINEVEGINTIKDKLLSISGIVEGTRIALTSNSITQTDLSQTTTQTPNPFKANSKTLSIAGENYVQLVKIGEIDPSVAGNYALSFKYKKSASSASVSGSLIIKNNESQLTNNKDDLSKMLSSFDVFGRWHLGANGSIGTGSYNKDMENFILQAKTEGDKTTIEVLVRLKTGESFSDLQWANDNLLQGGTNLTKGSKFGILDVQADDSKTFKSAILKPSTTTREEYPTSGKLIDDISNAKLIKKVTFFSDTLTSKVATSATIDPNKPNISKKANRTLEFYQYENVNFSLPLYYAVASKSDESTKSYSYDPINIYTNGVDSKAQQTILLESLPNNPTTLSPNTYNMFSGLKDALPEAAKTDFQDASKIQLVSSYYSQTKLTNQKLVFYDGFYAIGTRDEGWSSIDRNNDVKLIRISDPTSKIFAEKPSTTTESGASTSISGIQAQEAINERSAVLGFLSNVYEEFSKPNSGEFENERYSFTTGIWSAKGPNNSNISYENIKVEGSANAVYNRLNDVWSKLAPIMNKLFANLGANPNRYKVSDTNSSKSIIESYLAFVSPFTVNASQLESEISKAVGIVKAEVGGDITETTTYDKLTTETKKKLASTVIELIKIQFGTIDNEFKLRLNEPIYSALSKIINSMDNKVNSSISAPSSIFSSRNVPNGPTNLIYYQPNKWDNIVKEGEVTIKQAIKSIFDLLYFKNGSNILLGTSIYGVSKGTTQIGDQSSLLNVFKSLNPESLTSFDADAFTTQADKLLVYNKLFTTFTNLDLQSYVNEMLKTGNTISTTNLVNSIKTSVVEIIQKLGGRIKRESKSINSEPVSTFYLDDIISGTNAITALEWRYTQLTSSSSGNVEIINKIKEILTTNSQFEAYELSTWSNVIKGLYDFRKYSAEFSGRNGGDAVDEIAKKMILDSTILAPRSKDAIAAAVILEKIVSYMWWIVVALIGAGVLVSSTVGIATKDQRVKLSSRPILKWLLISGIVLGMGILAIALAIGIPPILI